MKAMMIVSAMLLMGSMARADGFECEAPDHGLNVKIYNQTNPNLGTRSGAVMLLSDESISFGNKTIARFSAEAGTLSSSELAYLAKVDLRFVDSNRRGENLLGTKLGQLKTIQANLRFSYAAPVKPGAIVRGSLVATKRNGEVIRAALVCTRYLKN